jgi:ArsR family transcriptional regulator
MEFKLLLDILGNETRREILHMLTERRCYVSQISSELNIGQKAIIEHLEIMERAGLLQPHFEKVEKGRPRKYFHVTKNLIMEVNLFSSLFDVKIHSPGMDERILENFPRLKELAANLTEATLNNGVPKIHDLNFIIEELVGERKKLTDAKKVIDFLLNEAKTEIEDEIVKERMKKKNYL